MACPYCWAADCSKHPTRVEAAGPHRISSNVKTQRAAWHRHRCDASPAELHEAFDVVGAPEQSELWEAADCIWNDSFPSSHIEVSDLPAMARLGAALGERDCSVQRRNKRSSKKSPHWTRERRYTGKGFFSRGSARKAVGVVAVGGHC